MCMHQLQHLYETKKKLSRNCVYFNVCVVLSTQRKKRAYEMRKKLTLWFGINVFHTSLGYA